MMTRAQRRAADFLAQDGHKEAHPAGHGFDIFNLKTGGKIRVTFATLAAVLKPETQLDIM
jgi:hypothetical protein